MIGKIFLISVRMSSRDPPFISPLVKHLLKFRNRLQKRSKPLPVGLGNKINHFIRENQRQAVKQEYLCLVGDSRAWWSTVNTISGRDTQPQLISSVIHQDTINENFCSLNSDPEYVALMVREYLKYIFMLSHFFFLSLRGLLEARMSSPTGFLEIVPIILLIEEPRVVKGFSFSSVVICEIQCNLSRSAESFFLDRFLRV